MTNYSKLIYKMKGFTFVELLIVLAVLATTGTVVISILFVVLRASSKSDRLINIKQNGNATLMQIIKQIRYAKSLEYPSSCPVSPGIQYSKITVVSVVDDGVTTLSCEAGPPATIASNAASLVDTNSVAVSSCSFTCSRPTPNDSPTITFSFKLDAKTTSGLVESTGSLSFQSSVIMRNLSK